MPTNLAIARVGLEVPVDSIEAAEATGDELRIGGTLVPATLAELQVLRRQLVGLLETADEKIKRLLFTDDPSWDGFYYVDQASTHLAAGGLETRILKFGLALRRVRPYTRPLIESKVVGALRPNDHSVTTGARPWHAVPAASTGYSEFFSGRDVTTRTVRTNTGGTATLHIVDGGTGAGRTHYYDAAPTWRLAPADYYHGACIVRELVDGTWYSVIGRQQVFSAEGWELENGLIRARIEAGVLTIALHDGAGAWHETATDFGKWHIGHDASGWVRLDPDVTAVTIHRNSPELAAVSIELTAVADLGLGSTALYPLGVDLALRRGSPILETVIHTPAIANWGWENAEDTGNAKTDVTGGMHKTSDTTDGNRWIILSPHAVTADAASGGFGPRLWATVNTSRAAFAIGWVANGGSAATVDTPARIAAAYWAAQGEAQQVSAR